MTKPIGPKCNLDCQYCFYLEKEDLYPGQDSFRMSDAVLEEYIRSYIQAQPGPEIQFLWQGGEPTLLGPDFFRKAFHLQRQVLPAGKTLRNALQTNGALLNDEWGKLFKEESVLVGLSLDGPKEIHDRYRVDKAGKGSFDAALRGLETLKKHQVEFNTLTVVSRANEEHGREVYEFLKGIGSSYLQFIPLVERQGTDTAFAAPAVQAQVSPMSVGAAAYGKFMIEIFDTWVRRDVGKMFVQLFEVCAGIWAGLPSALCVFSKECGRALAVDHNGDLYSCDHYVYPDYRLGNIMDDTIASLAGSAAQQKFGAAKDTDLPDYCRRCEVRFACNGECPKHRFARTPDGEKNLNYLCPSYKSFFNHVDLPMRALVKLARAGRRASDLMSMMAELDRKGLGPS